MRTYAYGSQPSFWQRGPIEITYNPYYRKPDGSPVLSQATGTYALGDRDEIRWITDGAGTFQFEVRSPVQTRDEILGDPALLDAQKREKLADHGYEPFDYSPT